MLETSVISVTCLRCETLYRCDDALHKPINYDVTDVVHVRFPSRCTLADFQRAVAAREKLGNLFAPIRNQAVTLRRHIFEGVCQLFIAVHLQKSTHFES